MVIVCEDNCERVTDEFIALFRAESEEEEFEWQVSLHQEMVKSDLCRL